MPFNNNKKHEITHLYIEGYATRYLETETLLFIDLQCKQHCGYYCQQTCEGTTLENTSGYIFSYMYLPPSRANISLTMTSDV